MAKNSQGNSSSLQIAVKKTDIRLILSLFAVWRLLLFAVLFLAVRFLPLQRNFLGGGMSNYLAHPYLFAWANFDGEHYLSIATYGYKALQQAFFPVYPLLIRLFVTPLSLNFATLASAGFLISNLALIGSLFLLWKLILLDFPRKIAIFTLVLLLIFPTSFYLGAAYNESLYLFVSIASFYAVRRNKWFLGGALGAIASATRVFGILLLPALLIEAWQTKTPIRKFFWKFLIPLGLIGYMYYQWRYFADPLAFYHLQPLVGEQHQEGIILLPQVFFRYAKILLNIDLTNLATLGILLEIFVGVLFTALPIVGFFKKMRLSYVFYAFVGFILPTIQGSFSSVPRYVLAFFPSFIVLAILMSKYKTPKKIIIIGLSILWLMIETALFVRGYWVA